MTPELKNHPIYQKTLKFLGDAIATILLLLGVITTEDYKEMGGSSSPILNVSNPFDIKKLGEELLNLARKAPLARAEFAMTWVVLIPLFKMVETLLFPPANILGALIAVIIFIIITFIAAIQTLRRLSDMNIKKDVNTIGTICALILTLSLLTMTSPLVIMLPIIIALSLIPGKSYRQKTSKSHQDQDEEDPWEAILNRHQGDHNSIIEKDYDLIKAKDQANHLKTLYMDQPTAKTHEIKTKPHPLTSHPKDGFTYPPQPIQPSIPPAPITPTQPFEPQSPTFNPQDLPYPTPPEPTLIEMTIPTTTTPPQWTKPHSPPPDPQSFTYSPQQPSPQKENPCLAEPEGFTYPTPPITNTHSTSLQRQTTQITIPKGAEEPHPPKILLVFISIIILTIILGIPIYYALFPYR